MLVFVEFAAAEEPRRGARARAPLQRLARSPLSPPSSLLRRVRSLLFAVRDVLLDVVLARRGVVQIFHDAEREARLATRAERPRAVRACVSQSQKSCHFVLWNYGTCPVRFGLWKSSNALEHTAYVALQNTLHRHSTLVSPILTNVKRRILNRCWTLVRARKVAARVDTCESPKRLSLSLSLSFSRSRSRSLSLSPALYMTSVCS